ncbi:MAG: FecR family protein, partial [Candidatus Saccharimonadales bacterium]
AYFQVKHQADKEFIVHAGKISVTVLGTSFDVSAFSDDPKVAVSLKEGKVLVEAGEHGENKQQNALLEPGEQAIFTKSTAILNVDNLNPKVSFGWETQDIFFENADIDEVLRKLQRYYGVTFDTGLLKKRHWHLTGEYKNETLAEVLESLSFNYNLKYRIEGRRVVLYEP